MSRDDLRTATSRTRARSRSWTPTSRSSASSRRSPSGPADRAPPPFDSLNASFSVGDAAERVRENRHTIARGLGTGAFAVAGLEHGSRIVRVDEGRAGAGFDDPGTRDRGVRRVDHGESRGGARRDVGGLRAHGVRLRCAKRRRRRARGVARDRCRDRDRGARAVRGRRAGAGRDRPGDRSRPLRSRGGRRARRGEASPGGAGSSARGGDPAAGPRRDDPRRIARAPASRACPTPVCAPHARRLASSATAATGERVAAARPSPCGWS